MTFNNDYAEASQKDYPPTIRGVDVGGRGD